MDNTKIENYIKEARHSKWLTQERNSIQLRFIHKKMVVVDDAINFYIEKHKNDVYQIIREGKNAAHLHIITALLIELSVAQNYEDIQDAHMHYKAMTKNSMYLHNEEKKIIPEFVAKYAKYGEFFYEIEKGRLMNAKEKQEFRKYIEDRRQAFPNDKTNEVRAQKNEKDKVSRVPTINKQLEEYRQKVRQLEEELQDINNYDKGKE